MPNPTKFSDINLVTSVAGYFANRITESGWKVYWQARAIFSGTGSVGEVTLTPEFPNEPSFIVQPPRERTESEIIIPAFAVRLVDMPIETERAGIGEDLFRESATIQIDGYVLSQSQHMAFSTMFRNWFRQDTYIPIWDWEANPVTPSLVDDHNVYIENRQVEALEMTNLPSPVRYYINMTADLIYYD
jgi:hypothetical protein